MPFLLGGLQPQGGVSSGPGLGIARGGGKKNNIPNEQKKKEPVTCLWGMWENGTLAGLRAAVQGLGLPLSASD